MLPPQVCTRACTVTSTSDWESAEYTSTYRYTNACTHTHTHTHTNACLCKCKLTYRHVKRNNLTLNDPILLTSYEIETHQCNVVCLVLPAQPPAASTTQHTSTAHTDHGHSSHFCSAKHLAASTAHTDQTHTPRCCY